jgi:hypothetical protein
LQQASVCAVLLRTPAEIGKPLGRFEGSEHTTLAPFIESCIALGPVFLGPLAAFLLWRLKTASLDERANDPSVHSIERAFSRSAI